MTERGFFLFLVFFIKVHVEEDKLLVIKFQGGERKRGVKNEKCCKYMRMETKRSPKFTRKFILLPSDANVERISALCVDGVLTVTMPRIPPYLKSKTIHISVN